jgi:hypothetical protein
MAESAADDPEPATPLSHPANHTMRRQTMEYSIQGGAREQ